MRDFDKKVNALLKEEADKPWGDYAFGDNRRDVPFEMNTPDEEFAKAALDDHFEGLPLNAKNAKEIQKLVQHGLYTDILQLPKHVSVVYRGMAMDLNVLLDMLDEVDPTIKGWQNIDATLKPRKGRATASWSIDYEAAKEFAADALEKGFPIDSDAVPIVFAAQVSNNPGAFIINPEKVYDVADWTSLSREQETIAVGPIKVSAIMLL